MIFLGDSQRIRTFYMVSNTICGYKHRYFRKSYILCTFYTRSFGQTFPLKCNLFIASQRFIICVPFETCDTRCPIFGAHFVRFELKFQCVFPQLFGLKYAKCRIFYCFLRIQFVVFGQGNTDDRISGINNLKFICLSAQKFQKNYSSHNIGFRFSSYDKSK